PQPEADLALPKRVEMGVDLVDQNDTVRDHTSFGPIDLDLGGKVVGGRFEVTENIDGEGQEAAVTVTQVKNCNLGPTNALEEGAIRVDPGDMDLPRKHHVNEPADDVNGFLSTFAIALALKLVDRPAVKRTQPFRTVG